MGAPQAAHEGSSPLLVQPMTAGYKSLNYCVRFDFLLLYYGQDIKSTDCSFRLSRNLAATLSQSNTGLVRLQMFGTFLECGY